MRRLRTIEKEKDVREFEVKYCQWCDEDFTIDEDTEGRKWLRGENGQRFEFSEDQCPRCNSSTVTFISDDDLLY